MKLKRFVTSWLAAGILASIIPARAALIPVTSDIAAGTTVTWTAANEYRLDTIIYVQAGATLIIEPGTVIKGATNVTIFREDIPELVSALWVTRGGKIIADGTRENPIIFTAEGDDLNGNIPPTESSLWGGVVIMGNAVINSAKDAAGNVSNPKSDVYEGVEGPGPNNEHRFGGNDDADNSGVLRYVSIRHCGRIFATDAELNCLTLGAVGSGTVIEHVEVLAGSDDGFEFWGGTVNTKYLVAAFIEDDDFDTDQGYRGVNQFWFGIKPPWTGTADSRGIESDGDLNQSAFDEMPLNRWVAHNLTSIGRGKSVTAGNLGIAWNTRDEDVPNVFNSVFAEWNQGLKLDADGLRHHTSAEAPASIRNNIWDVNAGASSADGQFIFTTTAFNNTIESAMLGGVSYANDGVLDPRPQAGSPVYSNVLAGAPVAVNYRGAFSGPQDNWADGWTALSQYGFLKLALRNPAPPTLTIVDLGNGSVELSWTTESGLTYQLESGSSITGAWENAGSAIPGTSSTVTVSRSAAGGEQYFRVRVQ